MNTLTPVQQQFVLHWGEMGTRWGINRTVAQIHALLFISPQPLPAEDIAETLAVARSNVSTSLKELQGWGIIKMIHVLGDKRDHFESMKDVWEMFRIVLDRECINQAGVGKENEYTRERLEALRDFFETTTSWYAQIRNWPMTTLARFFKLGDSALKLLKLPR
jgi:DNA-binding transcriptional regulator GbsR (MarR family)